MITEQNPVPAVIFKFESDFVAANIRCIPMIVRFKLDACGVKLTLAEWSRMTAAERGALVTAGCSTANEIRRYREDLMALILNRTGVHAAEIPVPQDPAWSRTSEIPGTVLENLQACGLMMSLAEWKDLTNLQRFALTKLSRPGHENKNFPRAADEFGCRKTLRGDHASDG